MPSKQILKSLLTTNFDVDGDDSFAALSKFRKPILRMIVTTALQCLLDSECVDGIEIDFVSVPRDKKEIDVEMRIYDKKYSGLESEKVSSSIEEISGLPANVYIYELSSSTEHQN